MSTPTPRTPPQAGRLLLPDVLRGLALLAMLVAHAVPVMPSATGGVSGAMLAAVNDVASPLFGLVMGMSAALMFQNGKFATRTAVVITNTVRGTAYIALGLWMDAWGSWIAIVLSILGVVLIIGTVILLLPWQAVAGLTAIGFALGPWLLLAFLDRSAPTPLHPGPLDIAVRLLLADPHYRAVSLLPFFLAGGLAIRFRSELGRWTVGALVVGVALFPVQPLVRRFTDIVRESGDYIDTVRDLALVLIVVSTVSIAARVGRPAWLRTIVRSAFEYLGALGRVALSLYVLQVALVAWFQRLGLRNGDDTPWAAALLIVGVCTVGILWWRAFGAGPLERIIDAVASRIAGLSSLRPEVSSPVRPDQGR